MGVKEGLGLFLVHAWSQEHEDVRGHVGQGAQGVAKQGQGKRIRLLPCLKALEYRKRVVGEEHHGGFHGRLLGQWMMKALKVNPVLSAGNPRIGPFSG
jgi:hypothetical protein